MSRAVETTGGVTGELTEDGLMEICLAAGVTSDEISVAPTYGLILSASAVRKLCDHAPNQTAADRLRGFVDFVQTKPTPGSRVQ